MKDRSGAALWLLLAVILTACVSEERPIAAEGVPTSSAAVTASTEPKGGPESGEPIGESVVPPPATNRGSDVIFDGSAGAADAIGAVSGLLGSLNSGDVLGALAYIDPAERDVIADFYLTTVEASTQTWPQFGGDDAIAALELEVLALTPLRATAYNDHLAWVETDEVEFYMAAPTEVAAAVFADQEPWGPGTSYSREEIAHSEDDWSEFTELFGSSSDVLPGLMITELDGRWYVSFGRTMLELLRIEAEFETPFPTERRVLDTTSAASPEAAVVGFLSALADDRITAAAEHLVVAEGQAFSDYPAMLDSWLPGLFDIQLDLDPASLRVVHHGDGRAVVEASELMLTVAGADHDEGVFDREDLNFVHHLRLAGECLTVNDEAFWCEPKENDATVFTSIYRDLGWHGLRLATVQNTDGWSVSLYETIAHYGQPIMSDPLYGLAYSQFTFSIFDGPLDYTLINEKAKTLPLQTTGTIVLEPQARNRLLIARIKTSDQERILTFDPSTLDRECHITIWNTNMVTDDWGEEPEFYDGEDCDDYSERPLEIPANVELTLTLWSYGEILDPTIGELR